MRFGPVCGRFNGGLGRTGRGWCALDPLVVGSGKAWEGLVGVGDLSVAFWRFVGTLFLALRATLFSFAFTRRDSSASCGRRIWDLGRCAVDRCLL